MRLSFALAALLAVTFAAYSRSFYSPFVFDDDYAITKNPSVIGQAPISLHSARSVLQTTFRLNYFFGGEDTLGYHIVNLSLHLANVLLLFGLLQSLSFSPLAALSGAALFALHPLQSESVIYISARSETLSCFFGLLGMLAFGRKRYIWASIVFLLAFYAKEIALVFPLMIGLRELLSRRSAWKHVAPVGSLALLLGATFAMNLEPAENSFGEHILKQSGQFLRFLGMIVAPINQTIDHDPDTLPWAYCGLALGALLALIVLAFHCREHFSNVTLGLGWLFVAVLPRFIINTPEKMAEHHLYVPLIGISVLIAAFFNKESIYAKERDYGRGSESCPC